MNEWRLYGCATPECIEWKHTDGRVIPTECMSDGRRVDTIIVCPRPGTDAKLILRARSALRIARCACSFRPCEHNGTPISTFLYRGSRLVIVSFSNNSKQTRGRPGVLVVRCITYQRYARHRFANHIHSSDWNPDFMGRVGG
jgi:hypothetical protein